jgi:hypothetical protein
MSLTKEQCKYLKLTNINPLTGKYCNPNIKGGTYEKLINECKKYRVSKILKTSKREKLEKVNMAKLEPFYTENPDKTRTIKFGLTHFTHLQLYDNWDELDLVIDGLLSGDIAYLLSLDRGMKCIINTYMDEEANGRFYFEGKLDLEIKKQLDKGNIILFIFGDLDWPFSIQYFKKQKNMYIKCEEHLADNRVKSFIDRFKIFPGKHSEEELEDYFKSLEM